MTITHEAVTRMALYGVSWLAVRRRLGGVGPRYRLNGRCTTPSYSWSCIRITRPSGVYAGREIADEERAPGRSSSSRWRAAARMARRCAVRETHMISSISGE